MCTSPQISSNNVREDLAPVFNQAARAEGYNVAVSAGDAAFTCTLSGRTVQGKYVAGTIQVPGSGIWFAYRLYGYLVVAGREKDAEKVLAEAGQNWKFNPQWLAQQRSTANNAVMQDNIRSQQLRQRVQQAIAEDQRQTSDMIMKGWEQRNKFYDEIDRRRENAILGTVDVVDPETGRHYKISNYGDYHYMSNSGTIYQHEFAGYASARFARNDHAAVRDLVGHDDADQPVRTARIRATIPLQSGEGMGEWQARSCIFSLKTESYPMKKLVLLILLASAVSFAQQPAAPRPSRRRYSPARNLTRCSPSPAASCCLMSGDPRKLRRTAGSRCTSTSRRRTSKSISPKSRRTSRSLLVSNHAHRAGIAADLLESKGIQNCRRDWRASLRIGRRNSCQVRAREARSQRREIASSTDFTGCGKTRTCHSERSEESLFDFSIRKIQERFFASLRLHSRPWQLGASAVNHSEVCATGYLLISWISLLSKFSSQTYSEMCQSGRSLNCFVPVHCFV